MTLNAFFMKPTYTLAILCLFVCASMSTLAQTGWQWARGSQGSGEAWPATRDATGNIIIAGYTNDTVFSFAADTVRWPPATLWTPHMVVAKFSGDGAIRWIRTALENNVYSVGVCTGRDDCVYFYGVYAGPTVTIGSTVLTNPGSMQYFLAKYDSAGNVMWAKNIARLDHSGWGPFIPGGISADAHDNIFISGEFHLSSIVVAGSITVTNVGGPNIFVAKLDSSGHAIWATASQGSGWATSMATTAGGETYITGEFYVGSLTFPPYTVYNAAADSIFASCFLVKYDPDGNVEWARSGGGHANRTFSYSVAADSSGNAYIAGGFAGPGIMFGTHTVAPIGDFVAKYDPLGTCEWANRIWGSNVGFAYGVTVDPCQNVWVAGGINFSTVHFGTDSVSQPVGLVGDGVFVVAYSPSGAVRHATALSAGADDNVSLVAANDAIYVCGDYMGDLGAGPDFMHASENFFVARYNYSDSALCPPPPSLQLTGRQPASTISIFPNPAYDHITIESTDVLTGASASLIDATGRVMASYRLDGYSVNIPVTGVPGGVYQCRINTAAGFTVVRKVVVIH